MNIKTVILFVFGSVFLLTAFSGNGVGAALVSVIIAAVFFFFGWRSMSSKKSPAPSPKPSATPSVPAASDYDFIAFKVAGVTFKNGRKSRQSILRAIKFRDNEFSEGVELELKPYEYESQPAYGVYANGQQIGNVPADMVPTIQENYSRILDFSAIDVYGGGRDEDMNTKNYGCEVTLRLKK